jgi:hypothetical protein
MEVRRFVGNDAMVICCDHDLTAASDLDIKCFFFLILFFNWC